jgi:PTS system cellobiose-specific IIA component
MSENENPMMGMSDEEKREYIINKAMEIIMNSGDARNYAAQARDEINNGNYAKAAQLLKEADKVQTAAHVTQTEMIQGDIRGGDEAMQYSVLFAHAQDTLMTIQVEINMTKAMLKMAESFEKRFAKAEN